MDQSTERMKGVSIGKIADNLRGKKIAIDDVVTTYSPKLASHKSAWSYLLQAQLRYLGFEADVLDKSSDIHEYDVWFIALPMEFQGSYNLFGGATDEPAARIQRFMDFKGDIWILNREMPDVGAFVKSRLKSCSEGWAALDHEAITEKCGQIETVQLIAGSGKFVLGDSHSVSVASSDSDVSRNDGKTLYGILKDGIDKWVPEGTEHLITYFGNIDVRHHICRQKNTVSTVEDLVDRYIEQLKATQKEYHIKKVSVHTLLPIEFEERRIPKTGWYKGTPFAGSQQERTSVMRLFNTRLEEKAVEAGFEVLKWPEHWYSENPEEFANKYMEKPGSVHLSREYYYWDWNTGEKNSNLIKRTISLF